jgi:hypothetical protein
MINPGFRVQKRHDAGMCHSNIGPVVEEYLFQRRWIENALPG